MVCSCGASAAISAVAQYRAKERGHHEQTEYELHDYAWLQAQAAKQVRAANIQAACILVMVYLVTWLVLR